MNAKLALVLLCSLSFSLPIMAADIPGGIVYSNGNEAIYYDFKTEKNKSLTSDLNGAVVKHPFAVSDNGKFLIWVQDNKFYVKELPLGTARAVQVNKMVYKGTKNRSGSSPKNDIIEDIVWQGGDIKNMTLCPDGSRFAFDTVFQEIGWVFTNKFLIGQVGQNKGPIPFYAKIVDSFNGIFYLSTIYNQEHPPVDSPVELNFSHPLYGNVSERPPALYYKASLKDLPSQLPGAREITGRGGEIDTGGMICYHITVKKSAHFFTFLNTKNWEEEKKIAAFIYQIGNQWGPIELRVVDTKSNVWGETARQGRIHYLDPAESLPESVRKCREWEILAFCQSCEGLFWKPDGSLTIQSKGDLYSIDASQIERGINQSGAKQNRKGRGVNFLPINNVFRAEPKLIAQGINGTCISWVSDDAFLFLRKDMLVYLWNQGKIESASPFSISGEFYYCSRSPFDDAPVVPKQLTSQDKTLR